MTEGTSQGLFIVVAIVIFGIFVSLSYTLFGKTLQPQIVNLFTEATEQTSEVFINKKLVYSSNAELNNTNDIYGGIEEFMQYTDLSPIFDEHGIGAYIFEFEIKANKEGTTKMYAQNGSSAKYIFGQKTLIATKNYQKHTFKTEVKLGKFPDPRTLLAFYSEYGSGVYPTVKNVRLYKIID